MFLVTNLIRPKARLLCPLDSQREVTRCDGSSQTFANMFSRIEVRKHRRHIYTTNVVFFTKVINNMSSEWFRFIGHHAIMVTHCYHGLSMIFEHEVRQTWTSCLQSINKTSESTAPWNNLTQISSTSSLNYWRFSCVSHSLHPK